MRPMAYVGAGSRVCVCVYGTGYVYSKGGFVHNVVISYEAAEMWKEEEGNCSLGERERREERQERIWAKCLTILPSVPPFL